MLRLVIGNKNYSSWSLRAWLLLAHFGIPFEETKLRLSFSEGSEFKRRLASLTPTGQVPVLVDGDLAIWDTLAIAETLAEAHPDKRMWPADRRQRARARSLCAEMHAGFSALRSHCPMNIEADLSAVGAELMRNRPEVVRDLQRIVQMWTGQLDAHGGPWLFGAEVTIPDLFFAPVCTRIRSYGLPVPPAVVAYIERIQALPAMQAWVAEALAEQDFLDFDEPYRQSRAG